MRERLTPVRRTSQEQEEWDQERRQDKAIAMLEAAPDKQRAIMTESSGNHVFVTVAVRGLAVFELTIPPAKYDAWNLMTLINQHNGTVPE